MPTQPFHASGNYLKTIIRSFYRNRSYTLLNLAGLSMGFAVFMFTAVYIYFETHFENFHHRADRVYRLTYQYTPGNHFDVHWARVPFDYINNLPNEVPGIKTLIRFQNHERKYVRVGEEKFRPANIYVTDKDVFDVFDFTLIAGNPATALAEPHAVVITKSLSKKYFGNQDPLGKDIYVIGDFEAVETLHRVTGIMEDLPLNTHLPVDMLVSYKDQAERAGWAYTYLLLEDGANPAQIASHFPAFIRKHGGEEGSNDKFSLQPLHSIHLQSNLAREIVPNGKVFYVRIVAFAGIFILIIAVINFMNLNSAMALGRAREIGMRKVLGASRGQLTRYLLAESVLLTLIALVLGAGIVYITFPWFTGIIAIQFLPDPLWFAMAMTGISVVCGVLAGLYPVMLLTPLKPVEVTRTAKALSFARRENPFSLKRIMVTMQFGISIVLLGSALIAYDQFLYLGKKNMGMTAQQVIAIPGVPDKVKNNFSAFRDQIAAQTGIVRVSACMEVPSREIRDAGPVLVEGINQDVSKAPVIDVQIIDHEFAPLLGLTFVAGGNIPPPASHPVIPEFTNEITIQKYLLAQPRDYLINETAMRQLGWQTPQEAIGQRISWSIGDMVLAFGPIRGVVKDFHQETLKNKVDPIVMVSEPVWLRTFLVKVETDHVEAAIQKISAAWNRLFPFYPMEYYFLDDLYNNLYKGERVQLQLLFIFSGLAIAIAFIGLVGLIAYALRTRAKEMAVRKVLGATLADQVRLLGREYLLVLLTGAAVAIPASVYGVQQWLSGFAYRVDVSPLRYVITVIVVATLLLATIGLQTLRASAVNPADTLREE